MKRQQTYALDHTVTGISEVEKQAHEKYCDEYMAGLVVSSSP